MSRKKDVTFDFTQVFERVKKQTKITSAVQLAEIIDISQAAVSKNKSKNIFPLEWAYLVAEKFKLELNWLIKGEGPIKPEDEEKKNLELHFLLDVEEWIMEEKEREPKIIDWFEVEFKEKFPKYAKWKRRVDREREDSPAQKLNVA